ncbi:hypothetical protein N9J80_00705 [Flavobacteriaceae bacterium]|jgi:hypothetical protein|nr:hypothetical protein [Flavobacteriaceae bacterium]
MVVLRAIFVIMILGCASKFNPESKTVVNTTESYFTLWNSPIRGGGSGYSVYIVLDKNLDLNAAKIEIQGLYFKDKYCTLKYQKQHLYQGFIKNKSNNNTLEMEGDLNPQSIKEDVADDIPFKLTGQEAVIVYKLKNVLKHVKIELREKQTLEVPM